MLRSLFGPDWKKSPAHLLLLSKFLSPKSSEYFSESDAWRDALGEAPGKAIERFLGEGVIQLANVSECLAYEYRVSDLKSMLRQRGLPVSGRKRELIARLVEADAEGMEEVISGVPIFQCSNLGRAIAEDYLIREQEKQYEIEQQVLDALWRRRFKESSRLVASFDAQRVFPRKGQYELTRDMAMLKTIFTSVPEALSLLTDDQLEQLRIAAGMMFLWGANKAKKWLPSDFETGLSIGIDAAARMLVFHASNQRSLTNYRQSEVVKGVEIIVAEDACEACRKLAGEAYNFNEVPVLPYVKCTHEKGCRCTYAPITKNYSELGLK